MDRSGALSPSGMTTAPEIHGHCDPRFAKVREAFAANLRDAGEIGAGISVVVDGDPVVDLWGGRADTQGTRPWERDTLVNVYSCTKGMTALCAHRLVAEGRLDIDAPVAKYWPEFAAAGKDTLPVRWLLGHRSGLAAVRDVAARRGAVRLGCDVRGPGRRDALVDAGHGARLPRRHVRLAGGPGGASHRRPEPRHLLPRGDRPAARCRFLDRSAGGRARPRRGDEPAADAAAGRRADPPGGDHHGRPAGAGGARLHEPGHAGDGCEQRRLAHRGDSGRERPCDGPGAGPHLRGACAGRCAGRRPRARSGRHRALSRGAVVRGRPRVAHHHPLRAWLHAAAGSA